VVEFYIKVKLILRIIKYLAYIYVWEIDNFVIKSDIWGHVFNLKAILNSTLNTSCSENIIVLSV
jgi:hypothetical protein